MTRRAAKGGLFPEDRRYRRPVPSTLAPTTPYEHDEQVSLFSWIEATARLQAEPELQEALRWIHSVPNGAHVHKRTAFKLVAEGLKKGVLDVSSDEPRQGYHGLKIEMKRKGNRPSPEQLQYIAYLSRVGYRAAVCYSWTEAARLIADYFALKVFAPLPKELTSESAAPFPPRRP